MPSYLKVRRETGYNDRFPGLENTQVNMSSYDRDRNPLDRRGLMFYRPTGLLPPDPNLVGVHSSMGIESLLILTHAI